MHNFLSKKLLPLLAILAAVFLGIKYLLPVVFPFLIGLAVAILAEPLVKTAGKKTNRTFSALLGVSLTLCVLAGGVVFIGAITVRQVGKLAGSMPQLAASAQAGMDTLKIWLSDLSGKAPAPLGAVLEQSVTTLFADGTVLLKQVTNRIPGAVTSVLGSVGSGALSFGAAVLSAFLFSCRLPKIKAFFTEKPWFSSFSQVSKEIFSALGGWLKAQLKLCTVTWGIVSLGFFILRIPGALPWALAVAVVDAVPILGTGTILIPWAVVCFLQKESLRAIGLVCIWGTAAIVRTTLEPKLVGNQLGLDPLVTLIALYVGFRFWGFPGLLLTPILVSAAKSLPKKTT